MPTKIKMITIPLLIQTVIASLGALAGLLFAFLNMGVNFRHRYGARGGAGVFIFVFLVFVVIALVNYFTYKGVEEKKDWAHVVSIILAVLMIFNFPIGTTLGVLILVGNLSDEAKTWFQKNTPSTPTTPASPTPPTTPAA